jgi:hypothetical protein
MKTLCLSTGARVLWEFSTGGEARVAHGISGRHRVRYAIHGFQGSSRVAASAGRCHRPLPRRDQHGRNARQPPQRQVATPPAWGVRDVYRRAIARIRALGRAAARRTRSDPQPSHRRGTAWTARSPQRGHNRHSAGQPSPSPAQDPRRACPSLRLNRPETASGDAAALHPSRGHSARSHRNRGGLRRSLQLDLPGGRPPPHHTGTHPAGHGGSEEDALAPGAGTGTRRGGRRGAIGARIPLRPGCRALAWIARRSAAGACTAADGKPVLGQFLRGLRRVRRNRRRHRASGRRTVAGQAARQLEPCPRGHRHTSPRPARPRRPLLRDRPRRGHTPPQKRLACPPPSLSRRSVRPS